MTGCDRLLLFSKRGWAEPSDPDFDRFSPFSEEPFFEYFLKPEKPTGSSLSDISDSLSWSGTKYFESGILFSYNNDVKANIIISVS